MRAQSKRREENINSENYKRESRPQKAAKGIELAVMMSSI
jgi:hypothetical protein